MREPKQRDLKSTRIFGFWRRRLFICWERHRAQQRIVNCLRRWAPYAKSLTKPPNFSVQFCAMRKDRSSNFVPRSIKGHQNLRGRENRWENRKKKKKRGF